MADTDTRKCYAQAVPRFTVEAERGWHLVDFRELVHYRDLLYFLVWRNVKVLYKQTILGFSWAIIRPFLSMLIFSIVFGKMAGMPSDGVPYPIFSFVALVPWTYFSTAMTSASGSLVGSAHLLTKVYFPRIIIPVAPVLSGLVDFCIALVMLGLMMAWYRIVPGPGVLLLPFLILLMIITAMGIGMWLAALAIRYRDVNHAVPFLSQLLMFAAPVVWPATLIPSQYRLVCGLYPMVGVIEGFRSALLGATPIPWDLIATASLSATFLLFSGALYFRRMERTFADLA